MLSVDFNQVSAITARGSQIERVYAGSDLVWTESAPLKLVVELSTGQQFSFDLHEIDQDYEGLDPFYMTWPGQSFADPFIDAFGQQVTAVAIEKVHDNQSTDEYGISALGQMQLPYVREIVLPKTKVVGEGALKNCKHLERIVLPNVQFVGEEAFVNCYRLSSVSFPSLEEFQSGAFGACSSLTSLEFGKVSAVPDAAFYEGTNANQLVDMSLPNVVSIGSIAFNQNIHLQRVYSPKLQTIGDQAFTNCSALSSIDLLNVESIGREALNNTAVTSMIAPTCKTIGYYSCAYSKIGTLYAKQLSSIGPGAFYGCPISSINVDNLEEIGARALSGNAFKTIDFHKLKSIGPLGVAGDNVQSIKIFNTADDGVPTIVGYGSEKSIEDKCIVYVNDPDVYQQLCQSEGLSSTQDRVIRLDCKDKTLACLVHSIGLSESKHIYITADKLQPELAATDDGESLLAPFDNWRDYSTGVVWHNAVTDFYDVHDDAAEVTAIDASGFYKFVNLSSASFPWCTSIGSKAFAECSSLTKLNIQNIESIGAEALSKTKLTKIDYPHLTSYGGAAFASMQDLQSIKLAGLLDAPDPLLTDASGLTSMSMDSLSSIGSLLGVSMQNLVDLSLPQMSSFNRQIAGPMGLPTHLSALNLASIKYDDFVGGVSAYVAQGFATTGCSLTCSDGVFVIK